MNFDDVRAQPVAVKTLKAALASDHVASAYLFEGPSGVGKERAALALASAVICDVKPLVGCGKCDVCRRIEARQHPDVRVVVPREEGDRNLQVEYVRKELLPFTQYAPFEARASFLIIRNADICFPAHHAEAANALLKTIEEPRKNVHFILLSERPDRLLQTIRSRCQRLRFQRLPAQTLEQILEQHNIPREARSAAIALADGKADQALAFAQGKSNELAKVVKRIDDVIESNKPGAAISLAEELAKHDDLELIIETLCVYYRDIAAAGLLHQSTGPTLLSREELHARASSLTPARAAARVESLLRARDLLDRNVSPEILLDSVFLALRTIS